MSGRVDGYLPIAVWPPAGWERTVPPRGPRAETVKAEGSDPLPSAGRSNRISAPRECETCASRKYQDESADPGVSFKAPTHIAPEAAAAAVAAHENEHVNRNQAKAEREGREVVFQSVQIHTAICPECGRAYVSGGTTTTVTRPRADSAAASPARPGALLDLLA